MSCIIAVAGSSYGQVGIKTENPKGVFHIDAKSDNDATPTAAQLENDVVVDGDGKVGIGIEPRTTDAARLQVKGPVTILNAGETPVDGIGYILATKDGSGQAKWTKNVSITPTIIGVLGHNGPIGQNNTDGSIAVPPHPYTDTDYYPVAPYDNSYINGYSGNLNQNKAWTGAFITLPPGLWIIQSNILLYAPTGGYWARLMWSDRPLTGTTASIVESDFSTDILSGRMVSGVVPSDSQFGLAVGTTLMYNTGITPKSYFLNVCFLTGGASSTRWTQLGSARWSENAIVAFPVTAAD